jgi:hypothetical protein
LPQGIVQQKRDDYAIAIRYLDHSLAPVLSKLDSPELRSNTIVVIAGDHGTQFGEYRLSLHGNSVYGQVLHVPLVLRTPTGESGRISMPIATQAIYETLLDLSGGASRRATRLPTHDSVAISLVLPKGGKRCLRKSCSGCFLSLSVSRPMFRSTQPDPSDRGSRPRGRQWHRDFHYSQGMARMARSLP